MGWAINYLLFCKIFVLNEDVRFGQRVFNHRRVRLGRVWLRAGFALCAVQLSKAQQAAPSLAGTQGRSSSCASLLSNLTFPQVMSALPLLS